MNSSPYLLILLICITFQSFGQLSAWELSTQPGNQVSNASTTNAANISTGILQRGAGVAASSASGSMSANGWFNSAAATTLAQAITNNEYYEFTLVVDPGFSANVNQVSVILRSSGTGPNTASLLSSADGFSSTLGTVTIPNSSISTLFNIPVSLTNLTGTTTFRLYGYGGASNGGTPSTGGTLRIGTSATALDNDLIISGTVEPICSAISAVISGNGSFCTESNIENVPVVVDISGGQGPYTVVVSDGSESFTTLNYISGTPLERGIFVTTTYTLVAVTASNGCSASQVDLTGSATVTIGGCEDVCEIYDVSTSQVCVDPFNYDLEICFFAENVSSIGLFLVTIGSQQFGPFSYSTHAGLLDFQYCVTIPNLVPDGQTNINVTVSDFGSPVIDGNPVAESAYGAPIFMSDDIEGWAGVNVNDLYVTYDDQYVYFATTLNSAANWQSWGFAINTVNGVGGSSEVWTYQIQYGHFQLPDFVIKGNFNNYAELRFWNGSTWVRIDNDGNDNGLAFVDFKANTNIVEVRIKRSALNNPDFVQTQFYVSGNNQNEHGTFDAVPDDQNVNDWNVTGNPTILDNYAPRLDIEPIELCQSLTTYNEINCTGCPDIAPLVNNVFYCVDAVALPLTATTQSGGTLVWYGENPANQGASPLQGAPIPSTSTIGQTTYWVLESVDGCDGPATTIFVTVSEISNVTANQICVNPASYNLEVCFTNPFPGPSGQFMVFVEGHVYGPYNYDNYIGNTTNQYCVIIQNAGDPSDTETDIVVTVKDVGYSQSGTPLINGSFDGVATWGSPISNANNVAGWAGANAQNLYMTYDNNYVYLGAQVQAQGWQAWAFIIDTKPGGGNFDSWSRQIDYAHSTKPDYIFRGTFGGYSEFHTWNGASWSGLGMSQAGTEFAENENEFVEVRIPRAVIGNINNFKVQFYITGNENEHGSFDAVPDDNNATDWNQFNNRTQLMNYATSSYLAPVGFEMCTTSIEINEVNCFVCPSIGSLSTSVGGCEGFGFDALVSGLNAIEMNQTAGGGPFGIQLKAFAGMGAPVNPYLNGTILGVVENVNLSNNDTEAVFTEVGSSLEAGFYNVCAILIGNRPENCNPFNCTVIEVLPLPVSPDIADISVCEGGSTLITAGEIIVNQGTSVMVTYNFEGEVTTSVVSDNTLVSGANASPGSGVGGISFPLGCGGSVDAYSANSWTQANEAGAVANNDYFQFSITNPSAFNVLTLSGFSFDARRSGTGPMSWAVYNGSNPLGFSGVVADPDVCISYLTNILNIQLSPGETANLRIYAWGNTNAAGTLRVDNVIVTGLSGAPSNNFYYYDADPGAGPANLLGQGETYDPGTTVATSPQSVWVTASNTFGCESIATEVVVNVYFQPVLNIQQPTEVCFPNTVNVLNVNIGLNNAFQYDISYHTTIMQAQNNTNPIAQNDLIAVSTSQTIYVRVVTSGSECVAIGEINVVVFPVSAPPVVNNVTVCAGGNTTIVASNLTNPTNVVFTWDFETGIAGPGVSNNQMAAQNGPVQNVGTGLSSSTQGAGSGCSAAITVTGFDISNSSLPDAIADEEYIEFCIGNANAPFALNGVTGINWTHRSSNTGPIQYRVVASDDLNTVLLTGMFTPGTNCLVAGGNITSNPSTCYRLYYWGGTNISGNVRIDNLTVTASYCTPIYNFYNVNPTLNPNAIPVATGPSYNPGTTVANSPQTFWVTSTSCAGCISQPAQVTVTVNANPTVYNVTGGGVYCAGGTPYNVSISGSQIGVSYQLQLNGGNVGMPVNGTGNPLVLGNPGGTGTYTAVASFISSGCSLPMNGSATVSTFNCTVGITDPCVCKNNATNLTNGQFNETVTVTAPAGQTWTISAVSNFFSVASPAPPAAPIPLVIGTTLTYIGNNQYTITGVTIDATTYNLSVTNALGTTLSISNNCAYPNPVILGLPASVCLGTTLSLNGTPGDDNLISQGFTVNGVPAIVFNPSTEGVYNVIYTINGGTPKAFGPNDPGCVQSVSQSITVNAVPVITGQPVDAASCSGGNVTFSVTATLAAGTLQYQWQQLINGTWTNITGATAASYTVMNVTEAMNNTRYRVIITNSLNTACSVTSNVAILGVHIPGAMTCNNHVNVSLDENCGFSAFSDFFIEGPNSEMFYEVILRTSTGQIVPQSQVRNFLGQILTVTVRDICSGNNCWGTVKFEDKFAPILDCPCTSAPPNVSAFREIARTNDKIYYRSNGTFSWQNAYAHSLSIGGQMVAINSAAENALIKAGMDANYPAGWRVWIGLTDNEAYGGTEANTSPTNGWVWVNGDPVTYTNWGAGEPNGINPGEDYVEMFASGVWNDNTNTSFIQGYILEVDNCSYTCADINRVINSTLITNNPNLLTADACGPVTGTFSDELTGDDCDGQQIVRSWVVTDGSGNTAECQQIFTFRRLTLADVLSPAAVVDLTCKDATDPASIAAKLGVGAAYPTVLVGGIATAVNNQICNIYTTYSDSEIGACGLHCHGNKKVIRTWTLVDWCLTSVQTRTQVIKAVDDEAPTAILKDTIVSTRPWDCTADFFVPNPWELHDDCDINPTWTVKGPVGVTIVPAVQVVNGVSGPHPLYKWRAVGAPKGVHDFKYTFVDCCGNERIIISKVTVEDKTPPTPVAKRDVVIGLVPGYDANGVQDGQAKLFAESIDNGSHDNCSGVRLEVRRPLGPDCGNEGLVVNPQTGLRHNNNRTFSNRVNMPNYSPSDTDGGEFVKFCCEDLNSIVVDANGDGLINELDRGFHEVILRVWDDGNMNGIIGDAGDNWNETWAFVKVESKVPPVITCPADATIHCDWAIETRTASTPVAGIDFTKTGLPTAYGVCSNPTITFQDQLQLNQCGIGIINRTFTIVEGGTTRQCVQRITVAASTSQQEWVVTPPSASVPEVGCDGPTEAQIKSNQPTWVNGPCDVIGVSHKVWEFEFEDGVCKKWVVEYKLVNWCDNEERGPYTKMFVYKDVVPPTFENCRDTMFAVDQNCELRGLTLTKRANDTGGCIDNGWIKWVVIVDLWADGTPDYEWSSFLPVGNDVNNAQTGNFAAIQDNNGNGIKDIYLAPTANGDEVKITIPEPIVGKMSNHKVTWKATDGCHNYVTCHEDFMVADKKAPTPVCVPLSSALMADPDGSGPARPMVELWAIDFNVKSFDNCTPEEDLLYTFDNVAPQVTDKVVFNRLINIDLPHYFDNTGGILRFPADMTNAQQRAIVEKYMRGEENSAGNGVIQLWNPETRSSARVWSDLNLEPGAPYTNVSVMMSVWDKKFNVDFCWTNLKLICNTCGDGTGSRVVSGSVSTEAGQAVNQVDVVFDANIIEFPRTYMTGSNGQFSMLLPAYVDYEVSANKGGDYLNGVSTLDLVLIQRHILGIQPLNSAYKMIAADATNDGKVTAADLTELRKLILGITNELPNNASWRFPISAQTMDNTNPWPFAEQISIIELTEDLDNQNFVAVKVGDVNGSVTASINNPALESRSAKAVQFTAVDRTVAAGEVVTVAISGSDFANVYGYQFTLNLKGASFVEVGSGAVEMTAANVGVLATDVVTMSYASREGVTVNNDETLFTVVLRAEKAGKLSEMITLGSNVTKAEAYAGADLQVSNVTLNMRTDATVADAAELFQNEPNPFRGQTTVSYYLPEAASTVITVYDVTGRVITVRKADSAKGMNSEVFTKEQIGVSGVLYYKLESGDFSATKKMIVIE
ncbi:MAG: T9SS type A sorting domain-containing protein [Saprospiraceae bacterium]|nr:T9SS type A sorting domain-containing protein [Saprospiraceae bacterium]